LPTLARGWWGIELSGYREHEADFATYSEFQVPVPPIERDLDESLFWLREQAIVPVSLAENPASPHPTRAATGEELEALVADVQLRLPGSFAMFVGQPELRTRVRSCTACYLDLAESIVSAPEGWLVHFLSDQQWVLHWLLYVGEDGGEAVIATDVPYGFAAERPARFALEPDLGEKPATIVCAESFSEFLYRFWIENEIWFALVDPDEPQPLTKEQQRYVEHYRSSYE
jgi:hypothetical protein